MSSKPNQTVTGQQALKQQLGDRFYADWKAMIIGQGGSSPSLLAPPV